MLTFFLLNSKHYPKTLRTFSIGTFQPKYALGYVNRREKDKKLLSKHWQTAEQMLTSIEQDYGIEFLPLRRDTAYTYARLTLNEAQDHSAPSDHVIIAHAITEHLTLLSSDQKFAFYRSQGLDLMSNFGYFSAYLMGNILKCLQIHVKLSTSYR